MRRLLVLAAVFAPAIAAAEPAAAPWIDVKDRGAYTEVIAHGVKSTKTAITPIRQRLEIPLAGTIVVKRVIPAGDPTIQLAEVDNEAHVLSVKLTMERADVKALAKSAQAMQIGDDLHLIFPRKVPPEGAVVTLPEPTLPVAVPALTPVIAPMQPVKATEVKLIPPAKVPDAPAVTKPELAPEIEMKPGPEAKPEAKPETRSDATSADDAKKSEPSDAGSGSKRTALGTTAPPTKPIGIPEEPGGQLMTYGALGLAAICGIWYLQRRRKATAGAPVATIEVIAQRSLGGKAKIVWLTAGGRDMIVAVTAQQVRMLGQWPRGEGGQSGVGTGARARDRDSGPIAFAATATAPSSDARDLREAFGGREPRMAEGTNPGTSASADALHFGPGLAPIPASAIGPASPAIQGLMRLRQRNAPPVAPPGSFARQKRESFASLSVSDDVATDDLDADAEWAKELMAATAGRGR